MSEISDNASPVRDANATMESHESPGQTLEDTGNRAILRKRSVE